MDKKDINQLIIEGAITHITKSDSYKFITIMSNKKEFDIDVSLFDSNNFEIGNNIRIVGKLDRLPIMNSTIYIVAQHIDPKRVVK